MAASAPVMFATAFEGLYLKGLKGRLTPELQAALRTTGFDVSKPLQAAYPFAIWNICMALTADALMPGVPRPQAVQSLGEAFIDGFAETLVGGAITQMGRLIGVERTLLRMGRNTRANSNAINTTSEVAGDGHVVMNSRLEAEFVGVVPPAEPWMGHFTAGLVVGIFRTLNAPTPAVEVTLRDPASNYFVYDVRWAQR